ncbi:hypothetical protein P7K49_035338 [Saguinus oedipus]|uniref:Uncharacterized protein n=1 Tax=Saguinus oedipus TaxID=9490 RepID=A0ABQ9TNB2_SAGOE|nr:hypothetical protein P7K49_035338 [Saguinus oedipus]
MVWDAWFGAISEVCHRGTVWTSLQVQCQRDTDRHQLPLPCCASHLIETLLGPPGAGNTVAWPSSQGRPPRNVHRLGRGSSLRI